MCSRKPELSRQSTMLLTDENSTFHAAKSFAKTFEILHPGQAEMCTDVHSLISIQFPREIQD